MATIISLMNRKGGVGKTTLTALLATAAHFRSGGKVLALDADPQRSIFKLRAKELEAFGGDAPYPVSAFDWSKEYEADVPVMRFREYLEDVYDEYDYIFIDTPGKQEGDEIPVIVGVSDIVVVPITGSAFDIQSTLDFLQAVRPVVERYAAKGAPIRLLGVVNRKDRTLEYEEIKELDGVLGLEVLPAHLSLRAQYKREASTLRQIVDEGKDHEFNRLYASFWDKVESRNDTE